jgi:hypothetical protein
MMPKLRVDKGAIKFVFGGGNHRIILATSSSTV